MRCQAVLLVDAGDEGLLGLSRCKGVEGKLAAGVGAELEEETGAVGVVGIYGVDESHPGSAVEVAFVGDGGERHLEFAGREALGDDGDPDRWAYRGDERGGVDEGG